MGEPGTEPVIVSHPAQVCLHLENEGRGKRESGRCSVCQKGEDLGQGTVGPLLCKGNVF